MDSVGYRWLQTAFKLCVVQPLAIESRIGKTRRSERDAEDRRLETFPETYRPDNSVAGHLAFALTYEGVHLELLSRLFMLTEVRHELELWARREPTGSYSRRACFLSEWLHPELPLDVPSVTQGNYVEALNSNDFFVGDSIRNPRWRVNDNLPGSVAYCPIIRRTEALRQAEIYDIQEQITVLEKDFGVDLILRSAVWLTIKESRASFQIEREHEKEDRVRRFAAVMENECGAHDDPLSTESLALLQKGILGDVALRYGTRKSPVYVGHDAYNRPVVDYIAPHWDQTENLLAGLKKFLSRTKNRSPIVRASVASFGFVYIHPMADGNGRISRFLINDILRRDKVVPKPIVLPVSATIAGSATARAAYDFVLEQFSKPLMSAYADDYRFGAYETGSDGVEYNFMFDKYEEALPAWRYQDLTSHVEYMARVIDTTLTQEMRSEASFLRSNSAAREGIKNVLEAPDNDLDAIIRSIRQNGYALSNKLLKTYPLLDGALGERVVSIVGGAFSEIGADRPMSTEPAIRMRPKTKTPSP